MSKFGESLPEEARANFQRLVVSGSKALEFLGSQTVLALTNLMLLRRDSLLADVRSTVPSEELSRLRHVPLPNSSALFPLGRWTRPSVRRVQRRTMLSFTRCSIRPEPPRDSLRARADPRQPRLIPRTYQGLHRWSPGNSNRRVIAPPQPPRPEAKRTNLVKVSGLFASPLGVPATTMASKKAHPSAQPDRAAAPSRVGGCLALHWRPWQAVRAEPWVVSVLRHGYRIPFQDRLPPLARSPVSFPTYPPNSPKALALRQEVDMISKGALERVNESGSRLLQSPFPGGKGFGRLETRDRPLPPQRVCKTNSVQDGDCLLSPPLSQRGRLPSIHRPERCLLPDPHPSLLLEVSPFRLRRDGPPVQSHLLRSFSWEPHPMKCLRGVMFAVLVHGCS